MLSKKNILILSVFSIVVLILFLKVKVLNGNNENRPNVILIMLDDNSAETLSCYGGRLIQTPNLDQIAMDGIRFDSCFSENSNRTTATLESDFANFIQQLHNQGYTTACVGKWKGDSKAQKFDFSSLLINSNEYFNPGFLENGKIIKENGFVTDVIAQKAIRFLKNRNKDNPFVLTFYLNATDPNCKPAKRHSTDLPKMTEGINYSNTGCPKQEYLKSMLSVDENIGRLVQYLYDTDDLNHTIIVYSSNKSFTNPLSRQKFRVPLLVRYPQTIMPNSISKVYCSDKDIFPTILDFAGIKSHTELNGKTLKPSLRLSELSVDKSIKSNDLLTQN